MDSTIPRHPGAAAPRAATNTWLEKSSRELGAVMRPGVADFGHGKYPGLKREDRVVGAMLVEKDVEIVLRDGKRLYCNVYRPADGSTVPPIICYAPFGKHPHIDMAVQFRGSGVPFEKLSDETIFEVFDPVHWVGQGYAIVTVDGLGNWASEGDVHFFGPEEARAGYDVVEWAAAQPWSTGQVGWGAVSYYAMSAWEVAALKPPHLACILPWEGASDVYRECYFRGGIPLMPLTHNWMHLTGYSANEVEDMEIASMTRPFFDAYWQSKVADWSAVEVPCYAVTGWPNDLHLRGTLEAWKHIASPAKYLDIHGGKEWAEFYADWAYERQKLFFDRFLKGVDNAVADWAPVRVAQRSAGSTWTFRDEREFPLARTRYATLWLDAADNALTAAKPAEAASIRYDSTKRDGEAAFDITFDRRTEITGYVKLRLWVAAYGMNDADLFVGLKKYDRDGNEVVFTFSQMFEDGPITLGWLRVSHRELDPLRSRPEQPVLKHERALWLQDERPVPVEIEVWPTNCVFEAGETLRLVIKGTPVPYHPDSMMEIRFAPIVNFGDHGVFAGGDYDSHLLLPIID